MTSEGELDLFATPAADGMARVAEREEARRARREGKTDRVAGWAESRTAEADRRLAAARQTADMIPLGQPMMPDHHSYRSDLGRRRRMVANFDRGFEAMDMAERHARRAEGIRRWEEERLTAPVTLRRIATLEAEQRKATRDLEGRVDFVDGKMTLRPPPERRAETLRQRVTDLDDEVRYWRAHLSELEASGVKLWGPGDFKKCDRVVGGSWAGEVVRVNPKSLSIRLPEGTFMGGSVKTVPYDKIKVNAGPGDMPTG